jgi:hypothetical protein
MKGIKVLLYVILMSVLGLGVAMFVTNPDQAKYDEYAAKQLSAYMKDNLCKKADGLEESCNNLLRDNEAEIKTFISEHTERENYGVVSLYKTDLSVDGFVPFFLRSFVPEYHFETVGVFGSFHTYESKEKK